jgi:hypothetical protein
LLFCHIVVGRLTCTTPCRDIMPVAPGAHIAFSTEQHTQSGGQERLTDPTVETSMRPVAGPLCAQSCAFLVRERAWRGVSLRPSRRQVDNPCSAAALSAHRAARQSSARSAAAVIGSPRRAEAVMGLEQGQSSAHSTGRALASGLLAWLCVLWDYRNGSSQPAWQGVARTRTELTELS